jgi:large subunit ribosomal protein L10
MTETLSPLLEEKKKLVIEIAEKMKNSKTVLLASTKSLPSSQFHQIKKNLRGKADIKVAKKSITIRAISATEKGAIQNLKEYVTSDIAIFFSQEDTFKLSALLADNQTPAKAKAGEISPDDINVDPGPTDLIPGPAISELSGVGLKVAVENGKLAIKQGATIVHKGDKITENVASVLGKLNINPMKVGFIPIAAYDSSSDKVYVDIIINKEETLESLRTLIGKALSFAANIKYTTKETIKYFIATACTEEKAIESLMNKDKPAEEKKEEIKKENKEEQLKEESKPEEKKDA